PVDQQRRLGQQALLVIKRQIGRPVARYRALQFDQRVDRQAVQRGLVGAARQQSRIGVVAEILDQQKPVIAILGIDLWRAEAQPAQDRGDTDIGTDILLRRRR